MGGGGCPPPSPMGRTPMAITNIQRKFQPQKLNWRKQVNEIHQALAEETSIHLNTLLKETSLLKSVFCFRLEKNAELNFSLRTRIKKGFQTFIFINKINMKYRGALLFSQSGVNLQIKPLKEQQHLSLNNSINQQNLKKILNTGNTSL